MIKLVVFDLWRTLAYRDVDYSTTARMLEKTGVKIPKKEFIKVFENAIQTRKWKSKQDAYENLCKEMGLETTKQNVELLMKIRDVAEAKVKLFPHTIPMLEKLREQEYKIGLISNSTQFSIELVKEKTGLLEFVDHALFSYQAGFIKPDLTMFKRILETADCKPGEAVMIGDKLEDDVLPARRLGMHAIHFENIEQLKKSFEEIGIII